jgi:hypothetical protein
VNSVFNEIVEDSSPTKGLQADSFFSEFWYTCNLNCGEFSDSSVSEPLHNTVNQYVSPFCGVSLNQTAIVIEEDSDSRLLEFGTWT